MSLGSRSQVVPATQSIPAWRGQTCSTCTQPWLAQVSIITIVVEVVPLACLAYAGTSKSAKRRAKEKQKTLAQRVGNDQVRVVNRGQPARSSQADYPELPSHRYKTRCCCYTSGHALLASSGRFAHVPHICVKTFPVCFSRTHCVMADPRLPPSLPCNKLLTCSCLCCNPAWLQL